MCIYLSMARATLITLLAKIASSTKGHHDGRHARIFGDFTTQSVPPDTVGTTFQFS